MSKFVDNRPIRSNAYQHVFHEVHCDYDIMSSMFDNSRALHPQTTEDILDLKEQIRQEFWKLAEQIMTERQLNICRMMCQGMTQWDIAKELNVNQSSVVKCFRGNVDYHHLDENGNPNIYGGVYKKMRKAIAGHLEIQELLVKLRELQDGQQDIW